MKRVKCIKNRIPILPEYQILRVPPNKDAFFKIYEIIQAMYPKAKLKDFNTFYNNSDTAYMIEHNGLYEGFGYLCHSMGDEKIPYKFRGYDVYSLEFAIFDECEIYKKLYPLVQTIIRDKNDRIIIVKKGKDDDKDIVNALKNCRFKVGDTYYYHLPDVISAENKEEFLQTINPLDDIEVCDKYVKLCNGPDIAAAQEKYMKDLQKAAYNSYKEELARFANDCDCECDCNTIVDTGCSWDENICMSC